MSAWVRLFGVSMTLGFVWYAGCGSDGGTGETDSPTSGPGATSGTGYDPVCNDGAPDGFCNIHGGVAESCECVDCFGTPFCNGECVDDGSCSGEEDCTCADCFETMGMCAGGVGAGGGGNNDNNDNNNNNNNNNNGGAGGAGGSGGSSNGGAGGSTDTGTGTGTGTDTDTGTDTGTGTGTGTGT